MDFLVDWCCVVASAWFPVGLWWFLDCGLVGVFQTA